MNDFKNIQKLWQNQESESNTPEQIVKAAKQQKQQSAQKHLAGIIVMGITTLAVLFFWVFFSVSPTLKLGLSLMFTAIFSRTLLEVFSYRKLRNIDPLEPTDVYRKKIMAFYRLRRVLMSLITTIAVLLYTTGFVLMLPEFKAHVSRGMYIYIVVFLIVALPLSAYLLYRQARNEFKSLSDLITMLV